MTAEVLSRPLPQGGRTGVSIAVIIPAYKQPGLLAEALQSVLDQRAPFEIAAVVVDDGCPFPETRQIALQFVRNHPGRICYVRKANGGLSSARNNGVAFALQAWPSLKAMYMLDADNRLFPDFLARAYATLNQSSPEVGWVYPDFDMFGVPQSHSARGRYSLLMHLVENYCEAGSLIRRAVFDAGIRFDETMRTGQEDWDFWLQAANAGFRGRHLPRSGFYYRKRIESMLSDGDAQRTVTIARMREKLKPLFHPRTVAALAQDEMPDFALYSGNGIVRLIADPTVPDEGRRLDEVTASRELVEAMLRPAARFFPSVMCFADTRALAALTANKLVRNVFWRAQILLRDCEFVSVHLERGEPAQLGLRDGEREDISDALLIFASRKAVAAQVRTPDAGSEPFANAKSLHALLPAEADFDAASCARGAARQDLEATLANLSAEVARQAAGLPADWRQDNRLPRNAEAALKALIGCRTLYPHRKKEGARDFGVLLPVSEFGGIERGKGNYAAVLRARGWRPHLFLTKPQTAHLSPLAFEAFESVNFVSIEQAEKIHASQHYFGMWTSDFAKRPEAQDLIGLLGSMDAIINNHSFAGHAVAARLRQFSVNTTVGVHMTERTPAGNPLGTPHSILGYEYGYDGIIVISDMLYDWCVGQGVPASKLHLVRNAPSYPSAKDALARSLKTKKRNDGPLRVLFLGRLDRQKGLDRLAEVIRRTRGEEIHWRLVGKAVIEDTGVELNDVGVEIEPPVHMAEDLDALYGWADVMILTSRFEGVPLSILEAQRLGCVALSTDVGAVREIIAHERDGLVVPVADDEETIVSTFCSHLTRLAGDRRLVRVIGLRAARKGTRVRWDRNLKVWATQLEAACDTAAASRPRPSSLRTS